MKSCGGLLAPDAQKILAQMGIGLPKRILTGPQIFTVRTFDFHNNLERYYQRFYFNIDREGFDRWLVSLIPDSVDLYTNCLFKSLKRDKDGFKINLIKDSREIVEEVKMVIGADGGLSKIRKEAFPEQPCPRKYISIQEWYETKEILPYFTAIFDPEITDFYSWTIPKENHMIVGAALEQGKGAIEKFDLLKSKLARKGFDLGKRISKEGAFIYRPVTNGQIFIGRDGIGLIGEAAGWISPSSAEGLSYAMKTGMIAGEILNNNREKFFALYAKESRKLRLNIWLKNLKAPFMYNNFLRKWVMRTGLQSLNMLISDK